MKCPRCNNEPAIMHPKLGVLPGEKCIADDRQTTVAKPPRFATASQTNRVQYEQDKNSKDLIQPWDDRNKVNRDFVEAYPDKAKEIFDDKTLQRL